MSFLQYLINGISIGSVYAIIALGYTMVYGIARMLNFAHGDVIMVGAYMSYCVTSYLGLDVYKRQVYAGASTMDRIMSKRNIDIFIAYSILICGLLALMNDFGTALIFFCAFPCLLYTSPGDNASESMKKGANYVTQPMLTLNAIDGNVVSRMFGY